MIGQLLDGRYQVTRALGSGGFGQTYIAQDTRRPGFPTCVVKHLKPATNDPTFLQTARRLFQSEAETLEHLGNHDQIPRLLAFFEQDQEFFLVQEFIEGHTLTAELPSGQQWAESQVVEMLRETLAILGFVHGQGVIHRDIKPDNLIRRRHDHRLVLVDFGAVKQIRTQLIVSGQGHISATVAIGTPGYMPTEQGQGKPRPNSDIYALGMIGIQALTGIYPGQLQEDLTTGELIWQHLVSVSPGLVGVLEKMTRYHFKDRYQSASEALQALEQLHNKSPLAAFPPPEGFSSTPQPNPSLGSSPQPIAQPTPQPTPPGYPLHPNQLPSPVAPSPAYASSVANSSSLPPTTIQSPVPQPPPAQPEPACPQTPLTPIAEPSTPKKMPFIIPLMIGCGGLTVLGFIGMMLLAIGLPSFLNQANRAREAEAKSYVGSMNRAQQAYRIEYPSFSNNLEDLQIGIPSETEHYSYEIYVLEPTLATMQVATAKQPELNSYIGLVWLEGLGATASVYTTTLLCVSNEPTTVIPEEPTVVEGVNGSELACPAGFSEAF